MSQNFNKNSDSRHFYGAVLGDVMLLELQRIFERALALHVKEHKVCFIRKEKQKYLLQDNWLCKKTTNSFQ